MVANAKDALGRIHTLGYLLIERYQKDAGEAGRQIGAESEMNEILDQTISDLRAELAEPALNVAYAKFRTDQDVRQFLSTFLEAFDQSRGAK